MRCTSFCSLHKTFHSRCIMYWYSGLKHFLFFSSLPPGEWVLSPPPGGLFGFFFLFSSQFFFWQDLWLNCEVFFLPFPLFLFLVGSFWVSMQIFFPDRRFSSPYRIGDLLWVMARRVISRKAWLGSQKAHPFCFWLAVSSICGYVLIWLLEMFQNCYEGSAFVSAHSVWWRGFLFIRSSFLFDNSLHAILPCSLGLSQSIYRLHGYYSWCSWKPP